MNSNIEITLCTAFDQNYLVQALTMIDSLETNSVYSIRWNILALTTETLRILNQNRKTNWNILEIADLNDPEFESLQFVRGWREFCWTSASVLLNYTVTSSRTKYVGYVDSDCYFFHSIEPLIRELGDSSILIFPHNFSRDRVDWLKKSGEFNVGLILGLKSGDLSRCILEWRQHVIKECVVDPEQGKCGDQTYLDEWPIRFESVKKSQNIYAALGPWNLNNFKAIEKGTAYIANREIIFFHFHGLLVFRLFSHIYIYLPAPGYNIQTRNYLFLYKKYLRHENNIAKNLGQSLRSISALSFIKASIGSRRLPRIIL